MTVTPATAQRVVISQAAPGVSSGTDLIDMATGAVQHLTDDITDKAVFLSDGAVLLRRVSGEQTWRARFMSTGAELALPDGFAPVFFGASPPILSHPRGLAAFARFSDVSNGSRPARLDAAGLHVFSPCAAGQPITSYDLSADGAALLALCLPTFAIPSADAVVLDAATGAVRSRLALPAGVPVESGLFTASADEFLSLRAVADWTIVRASLSTGGTTGTVSFPFYGGGVVPGLLPNPRDRNRPLLVRCGGVCTIDVVDAVAMTIGPRLYAGGAVVPIVSFSADGRDVVLSGQTYVARVDMATGALLNEITAGPNGFVVAAWGAEPQAPTLAAPVVAGGNVTFSWTLPLESAAASAHRLEAGYAPGTTAVSLDLGPALTASISGVPPGRYYARLRAVNANGVSAPSNEVVVDVP